MVSEVMLPRFPGVQNLKPSEARFTSYSGRLPASQSWYMVLYSIGLGVGDLCYAGKRHTPSPLNLEWFGSSHVERHLSPCFHGGNRYVLSVA